MLSTFLILADLTSIESAIKTFGWPGALLIGVVLGAWRIWVFLKPYISRIFEGHISLLSTLAEAITVIKGSVVDVKDVCERQEKAHQDSNSKFSTIYTNRGLVAHFEMQLRSDEAEKRKIAENAIQLLRHADSKATGK